MSEWHSLGQGRDRISFQRRLQQETPDEKGRVRFEWQDISPQFDVDLIPLRSGDQIMAGRIAGVTAYRLKCWHHPSIENLTVTDRAIDVRNQERVFKITSVLIGPERDFVDIVLTFGAAA